MTDAISSGDGDSDEYGASGEDSSSGSGEYGEEDSDSSGSSGSVDSPEPGGGDPSASGLGSAGPHRLQEKVTQDQQPGGDTAVRQDEEVISASAGDANKLFK